MMKTLKVLQRKAKFPSTLFKGWQSPETESLVALRRARNTLDAIPPQGVNPKTVRWTVLGEGAPWERGRPLLTGCIRFPPPPPAARGVFIPILKIDFRVAGKQLDPGFSGVLLLTAFCK